MYHGPVMEADEPAHVSAAKLLEHIQHQKAHHVESVEYLFVTLTNVRLVKLHAFVAAAVVFDTETEDEADLWKLAEALVATELLSRLTHDTSGPF